MNKSNIKKLENKFNLSIWVKNKYSGHYAYELEILDYNTNRLFTMLLNNSSSFYKQIENKLKGV